MAKLVKEMNKVLTWIVRIIVLVIIVKVVIWSWEQYQSGGSGSSGEQVPEWNRVCRITNPDLGSCVCTNKDTNERLSVPYDECVKEARKQR